MKHLGVLPYLVGVFLCIIASSFTKKNKKGNAINVYILHLIKLVGSASPIFISHQMGKKSLSSISYSENVIASFTRFEEDYSDSITVNVYPAVLPPKLMHDDICSMALDKHTSLIILLSTEFGQWMGQSK